jgi:dihydroflavonol-4-reductase
MAKEKIFVTGATGCLGASLIRRLVENGNDVHALIYPGTNHPYLDDLNITRFDGDILNIDSIRKAMKGCSSVYHVAGIVSYLKKDFQRMVKVHVEGTRIVLSVAIELGVRRVVHTSSCAAIGLPTSPDAAQDENTKWDPKFDKIGYMYSKRLAEEECRKACEKGLDVVMVNPTSFWGQGDINMNEGEIIKKISNGKVRITPPGGNSVVSVDDTVNGHLLAMTKGKMGERYILSNEFLPFIELMNIIAKELGVDKITKVLPKASFSFLFCLAYVVELVSTTFNMGVKLTPAVINFSFNYRYYKSDKARKELGWKPKDSFRKAIKKAIEFYRENELL